MPGDTSHRHAVIQPPTASIPDTPEGDVERGQHGEISAYYTLPGKAQGSQDTAAAVVRGRLIMKKVRRLSLDLRIKILDLQWVGKKNAQLGKLHLITQKLDLNTL